MIFALVGIIYLICKFKVGKGMRKKDVNKANGTHVPKHNQQCTQQHIQQRIRHEQQSGVFHIILRGYLGKLIFKCDDDKMKFLRLLKRFLDKDSSVLYAFVLMDNHAHLLLKTDQLSVFIRNFISSYSSWFNLHYNRRGPLFKKPFTSFPKNNESWKVDCLLYILLNPVEAGICKHPSQYIFSSYNFYTVRPCRLKPIIEVSPDIIARNFTSHEEFRKALYSKLEYQENMKRIKYRRF